MTLLGKVLLAIVEMVLIGVIIVLTKSTKWADEIAIGATALAVSSYYIFVIWED